MRAESGFEARGWMRFERDAALLPWVEAARRAGRAALADPALRKEWLQCEGTWFVGVDALPTAPDGRLDGVPLAGNVIDALSPLPPLHRAQLSVVFPGYPLPRAGEGEAAFRYRRDRAGAHVDGLLPVGPERRRMIREPHGFVLGLPLTEAAPEASPLVVWEGSHRIMGAAFRDALGAATGPLDEVDITEGYAAARKRCFETCRRVALPGKPGEALLLHRHLLHGIAPWQEGAHAPPEGRMSAYFRPLHPEGIAGWLQP